MTIDPQILHKLTENPKHIRKLDAENILKTLDDAYYNQGITMIPDELYDEIKRIAGIDNIGAEVDKKDAVKLPFWMGSQNKITEQKDIENFIKKYNPTKNKTYFVSDKLDGISTLLVGNNKKCKMYTRGNGVKGQDITKVINFLGIKINTEETISIRGELILDKSKAKEFVNTRNIVAGVVNRKNINKKDLKYIDIVAFELIQPTNMNPKKQLDFIKQYTTNIKTVHYQIINNINKNILESILKERKNNNNYDVDGIVVTTNDVHERNVNKNPNYSFAFKNNAALEEVVTKVVNIEWNISKDGYIKPTIIVEPIDISGVKIKRTTGFNADFIVKNKIKNGTMVAIRRSGDVIPYITKVYQNDDSSGDMINENDLLPRQFKWSWNKTKKDIIIQNNQNENNEQSFKNLEHFYNVVRVKHLSTATLRKLFDNGYTTPKQVYDLTKNDLAKCIGSEKVAEKIKIARNDAFVNINQETLMIASNAFGRGIGEAKIKLVLQNINDVNNIKSDDDLLKIKGISTITAEQFIVGLQKYKQFIKDNPFNEQPKQKNSNNNHHHKNKLTVLFTGFRNKQLEDAINSHGGNIAKTFNKDVNILVIKDETINNAKVVKARQNNIKVVDQNKLLQILEENK